MKQKKINICGRDCKEPGDGQCNGYCKGDADAPRKYSIEQSTIEELLSMKVLSENHRQEPIQVSPEFRVAVQKITTEGVHIILHANGHDSDTLDLLVKDDKVTIIDNSPYRTYENE